MLFERQGGYQAERQGEQPLMSTHDIVSRCERVQQR
jgi:hypothetical protein